MLNAVTTAPASSSGRCQFPGCGSLLPARVPGQRGAPRRYCDNPSHTAQKAMRLVRDVDEPLQPSSRPVTDGALALAALLDRYTQLRGELATVAGDVGDLFARLTDPAAVDREITEIQRQADRRVAVAEQAQADAEQASQQMARRLERALEVEGLALATAREARATAREARHRVADAEKQAAVRVRAAQREWDRVCDEAAATATEMREIADTARIAQARAEGERDVVRAEHRALVVENTQLRALLDTERTEHRQQIERRDIEYARAITAAHALANHTAREHREQLTDVIHQCAGYAVAGHVPTVSGGSDCDMCPSPP